MTRPSVVTPRPSAFVGDGIIDGSKLEAIVLDANTIEGRYRRPVSIFPVADSYSQIGIRVEAAFANTTYPWQHIGSWLIYEEIDKLTCALECYLLCAAMSSGADNYETWEFQWLLVEPSDMTTNVDTVTGILRDNIQLKAGNELVQMADYTPNTIEGRPLAKDIQYMTLLEFRGDDMPDLDSGNFPYVISLQARAANDTVTYRSYHQKLFVYSCLLIGEAV